MLSPDLEAFAIEWAASGDPVAALEYVWGNYLASRTPSERSYDLGQAIYHPGVKARYEELLRLAEDIKFSAVRVEMSDAIMMLQDAYLVAKISNQPSAMVQATKLISELLQIDPITKGRVKQLAADAKDPEDHADAYRGIMADLSKSLPD